MMSQRIGVPTYARGGGRHLARRIALSVLLGILLSCTGVALVSRPTVAASGRAPGGNMQQALVREVDIAQPAIVRIATIYHVHATFMLCGLRYSLPTSGQGYLVGGTGSGAFISSNGDILTADHVVDIPQQDLQAEVVQVGAADIANLLDNNPPCHLQQPVTAAEIAAGFLQAVGIPFTVESSLPQSLVWQSTSFAGQTSAATSDSLIQALQGVHPQPARILKSSPFTENDLAILHVDSSDTPSIQLDNSSSVAVEDQLTIIGFPGNGDVNNSGTDLLTPSVNNITVSAIKNGTNGQKLIQVGGNVEHGDSGGPALDSDGLIVGVVSFGGDDPRGITAFLRSSDNALSLMSAANVDPKPGTL
ncbi:MAG TPA: trypsin-like peptidase domain-containing protein, partial [Ktedonobacterales bacterium]|nr:trypsin-like peptidase domain-containing protein [Ktedonobacterales bacterium]